MELELEIVTATGTTYANCEEEQARNLAGYFRNPNPSGNGVISLERKADHHGNNIQMIFIPAAAVLRINVNRHDRSHAHRLI